MASQGTALLGRRGVMLFLVVDLKGGGLDGWYSDRKYAEASAEAWSETLGHGSVIVVEFKDKQKRDWLIYDAALLNRRVVMRKKMFAFHSNENRAVDYLGEVISEQSDLLRIQAADAFMAVGLGLFELTSEVKDFPKRECRMFLDSGECLEVANLINKRIREEIRENKEDSCSTN